MAVSELVVKLIGDISGFAKTMGQVAGTVQKTGKSISQAGKSLTTNVTLPLAGIGLASLAMAGDFQASMSKVSALGGITGADLTKLESQAIELGASTQFSAKQAADGMAEFAAAGFKTEEISRVMAGTLDLAAAAQISVGEAASITISSLGQFNLKAEDSQRVADTMAKAAAEGALTITELAESMKYVGPVAGTMGHSIEDTAAAITMLSGAGIKGSEAGTALRMGLIRIIKPTKQAQEAIDKYGLSLTESDGRAKSMTEIIKELEGKHVSLADLTKLVGVNAVSAWSAMQSKGSEALDTLTTKVNDHKDSAKDMAKVLRDNLKGDFEQMMGAVETLGITIGTVLTPAARALMGVVQALAEKGVALVQWFRSLNQNTQNAVIAFLAVVAVIGPTAIVIGKLVVAIGALMKAMSLATGVVALFASATGIGLIAIALGLVVAAIVYFKDDIYAAFVAVKNYVIKFVEDFNRGLDAIATAWDILRYTIDVVIEEIKSYIASWVDYFWMKLGELGDYLSSFVNQQFLAEFKEGFRILTQWTSDFVRDFKLGWDTIKEKIGLASKEMVKVKEPIKEVGNSLHDSNVELTGFLHGNDAVSGALKNLGGEAKKTTGEVKKQTGEVKTNTGAKSDNAKATGKLTEEEKAAAKAAKEHEKAIASQGKEISELVIKSAKYKELQERIKSGDITAAEGADKLKDLYIESRDALNKYNEALDIYEDLVKRIASGEQVAAGDLSDALKNLDLAKSVLDGASTTLEGEGGGFLDGILSSITSSLGGSGGASGGAASGFGAVGAQLGQSLMAGLQSALSGEKMDKKQIGQTIGSGLGGAIGSYWGPIGAQIGSMLGGKIGEELSSHFGTTNAQTKMRMALDKLFAEALKDNPLQAIIEGQLKTITDLDFFGGTDKYSTGAFANVFNGLTSSAQAAFSGVATGFTQLFETGEEISAQLAAVLADNLGGSLNNLQLLVQSTGKSFEELEGAVTEAFLDGKLSMLEAQTALNGIAQISQKGIPDGIGFTIQAFQNLKDAGVRGGRASTDAMRDMADEAKELGITTLPALMQNLVASGKFSQKEIEQVFQSLKDHGIDSVEALAAATDQQLIGVLSQLQAQEFPFADAVDDAEDLTRAINEMPKNKDITFNMKTNLDANTQAAMDAGFVPNAQGATVQPRQNAKGNVFSAGAVVPFAKGGVVGDYTMFDIGSMAERGPEAIMPLKRMSDGSLGVRSANSEAAGNQVNITIHAPYASPGIVETIRREMDKHADKLNRLPGIRR